MSLPYSEQTDQQCYSLQNITEPMRLALIKKLNDQPVGITEMADLLRIEYALSKPTPLNTKKK